MESDQLLRVFATTNRLSPNQVHFAGETHVNSSPKARFSLDLLGEIPLRERLILHHLQEPLR